MNFKDHSWLGLHWIWIGHASIVARRKANDEVIGKFSDFLRLCCLHFWWIHIFVDRGHFNWLLNQHKLSSRNKSALNPEIAILQGPKSDSWRIFAGNRISIALNRCSTDLYRDFLRKMAIYMRSSGALNHVILSMKFQYHFGVSFKELWFSFERGVLGKHIQELRLTHFYQQIIHISGSNVVFSAGIHDLMDCLTARIAYEHSVEWLTMHVIDECSPEKIKMYCVVGFEAVHPENIGEFIAAMDVDFVVPASKLLDDSLSFCPLLLNQD